MRFPINILVYYNDQIAFKKIVNVEADNKDEAVKFTKSSTWLNIFVSEK